MKAPIIIVSVGRSGSTIFYKMLAEHPELSWLSGFLSRYPTQFWLNRLVVRAVDLPGIRNWAWFKKKINPGENYPFWDYYWSGFSTPVRDLEAEDVTVGVRKKLLRVLGEVPVGKRDRLLLKVTGWPRVRFFQALYPDAKFIHVVRDGRSVANSLIKMDWWWGWRGPENWRWGLLSEQYQQEWEGVGRSFIGLAAIEWKLLMDRFGEVKQGLNGENYKEVQYEQFCLHPVETMKEITAFAGLEWSDSFARVVAQFEIESQNEKWRSDLTEGQQQILDQLLEKHLEKWGYQK